jgi:hypothetical protein
MAPYKWYFPIFFYCKLDPSLAEQLSKKAAFGVLAGQY